MPIIEPTWVLIACDAKRLSCINPTLAQGSYNCIDNDEVFSHFAKMNWNHIHVYILRSEKRDVMGEQQRQLRHLEIKWFNCHDPHMISECLAKQEYYKWYNKGGISQLARLTTPTN